MCEPTHTHTLQQLRNTCIRHVHVHARTRTHTHTHTTRAEMRDTSDIDDRVASKYYSHLFNETMLPRRFPIGKEKIVVSPPLSAPPSNPPLS